MSLYRKYRPASFDEVVGQEQVTKPLSAALDSGRINHAYLFSGPRGCGKTSSARILARSLNCVHGPTSTPCGQCDSCRALAPGGPGNLDVTELDAASNNGVEDMRELRDRAYYAPADSRYRVFIIDECHMISSSGANALLKIVEEPPEHVVFVFATTEPEKVIGTIRSRTHHYPFRLLTPQTMRGLLQRTAAAEGVEVEDAVYPLVIRAGGGSPRDSLSILDQLIGGSGDGNVTYQKALPLLGVTDFSILDSTVEALAAGDGAKLFATVDDVIETGIEPRRFVTDLLDRLRDLMVVQTVPEAFEMGLVEAPAGRAEVLKAEAALFSAQGLARLADQVNERMADMRGATSPRLLLEILLAHLMLTVTGQGGHAGAAGPSGQGGALASGGGSGAPGASDVGQAGHAPGYGRAGGGSGQAPVKGSRASQAAREAVARAQAARGQAASKTTQQAPQAPEPQQAPAPQQTAEAPEQTLPDAPYTPEQTSPDVPQAPEHTSPDVPHTPEQTLSNGQRPADTADSGTPGGTQDQGRPSDGGSSGGSRQQTDDAASPAQGAPASGAQGVSAPAQWNETDSAGREASADVPQDSPAEPAEPAQPEPARAESAQPEPAQSAQSEPAQPAEPATGDITAAVRERWGKLRDQVGKRNQIAQILLAESHVLGMRESTVVLGHNTGALAERINSERHNSDIAAVLTEEFGRELSVHCEVGTDPAKAGFSAPAEPAPAWNPHAAAATSREHQAPAAATDDAADDDDPAEPPAPGTFASGRSAAGANAASELAAPEQRADEPAAPEQRADEPAAPEQHASEPGDAPIWGEPAKIGGHNASAAGTRSQRSPAESAADQPRQSHSPDPAERAGQAESQPAGESQAQNPSTGHGQPAAVQRPQARRPETQQQHAPGSTPTGSAPTGSAPAGSGQTASGRPPLRIPHINRVVSPGGGATGRGPGDTNANVPHSGPGQRRADGPVDASGMPVDRHGVPLPPEPADDDVPPPPEPWEAGGPRGPRGPRGAGPAGSAAPTGPAAGGGRGGAASASGAATPGPSPEEQARSEEEDMMREAALQPGHRDRRDAMTVAMELLAAELGAKRM